MPFLGLMMISMSQSSRLDKITKRSAIDASLPFVANISGVQLDMGFSFYVGYSLTNDVPI